MSHAMLQMAPYKFLCCCYYYYYYYYYYFYYYYYCRDFTAGCWCFCHVKARAMSHSLATLTFTQCLLSMCAVLTSWLLRSNSTLIVVPAFFTFFSRPLSTVPVAPVTIGIIISFFHYWNMIKTYDTFLRRTGAQTCDCNECCRRPLNDYNDDNDNSWCNNDNDNS